MTGPLSGFRVGITSARKVEELTRLLERRGATVESAPALAVEAVDDRELLTATAEVVERPPDVFVATTGLGLRRWFDAASSWGLLDPLLAALRESTVLARGPKAVGVLRAHDVREAWCPASECLDDLLTYMRATGIAGKRVVVQEHGESLEVVANALRQRGAQVQLVSVYRCAPAQDQTAMFRMVDLVAERKVDAVTFTSAPAVEMLLEVALASGRRTEVLDALRAEVLATCVGPVTSAPLRLRRVPVVQPERARLAAMVKALEEELPSRRRGTEIVVPGHRLLLHGDRICLDGAEVRLSPAPRAVLEALAARPGRVVSRHELTARLSSGTRVSEHAAEMAVARLRAALGADVVQTVVKRGYRLPVVSP